MMNNQEFIGECLRGHNKYRLLHGVSPLRNCAALERSAQAWANNLINKNSEQNSSEFERGEIGEIISWSSNSSGKGTISGKDLIKKWYGEITDYDFTMSNESAKNFTQMIWKSTEKVGFGIAYSKKKCVVVAHYSPPGNIKGNFTENVLRQIKDFDLAVEDGNSFKQNSFNGTLNDAYVEGIRPFIDIIDTLRKYGLQQYVELPNVVLVGDQSSGKSSIIEVISGIQLPRGAGIVTRCPLELQLKKVYGQPWKAIISYMSTMNEEVTKTLLNPEEVEKCVSEAQEDMCHTKSGVSKELITLRIESPAENAPDLTMIDMPGIARTAILGQPTDICDQIREIIMGHLKNENTVILCVISGDLDIAVNESVNLAKEVDPEGKRTLGVITKPDMADLDHKKGILNMMENKTINLKKGFNLVKCRSLEQLKNNLPLSEFLHNEMEFYENDEFYKEADSSRLGAINLSRKITDELVAVIKKNLPELQKKIEAALEDANYKLNELPQCPPLGDEEKRSYMVNLATELNEKVKGFIFNGEMSDDTNYYYLWRSYFEIFRKALEKKFKMALDNQFSQQNLLKKIEKYRGKEISGFLNYKLFDDLLTKYIESYKKDANELILTMSKVIKSTLEKLLTNAISHFPLIEFELKKIVNLEFENCVKMAQERVGFIFKQEALIFTMDNVFDKKWEKYNRIKKEVKLNASIGVFSPQSLPVTRTTFGNSSSQPFSVNQASVTPVAVSNSENLLCNITCYLKIVHTRLSDYVPMAVMQCLLVQLQEQLKIRLIQYLSSSEIIEKVKENPSISKRRKQILDKISCLDKGKYELESKYNIFNISF